MQALTVIAPASPGEFCKRFAHERGQLCAQKPRIPQQIYHTSLLFNDFRTFEHRLRQVFVFNTQSPGSYAIVRGEAREGAGSPCERSGRTFCPVPRRWVALDIDSGQTSWTASDARSGLPSPWRDCACVWHRTGSYKVRPGARLQLWFLLSSALCDTELHAYWHSRNERAGAFDTKCDLALFQCVQPHFVSHPIIPDTATSVVSGIERFGVLGGIECVDTSSLKIAQQPESREIVLFGRQDLGRSVRYFGGTIRKLCEEIRAAPEGERQIKLVSAFVRVSGMSKALGLNPAKYLQRLADTALEKRPDDTEEINRALAWALERVGVSTQWD